MYSRTMVVQCSSILARTQNVFNKCHSHCSALFIELIAFSEFNFGTSNSASLRTYDKIWCWYSPVFISLTISNGVEICIFILNWWFLGIAWTAELGLNEIYGTGRIRKLDIDERERILESMCHIDLLKPCALFFLWKNFSNTCGRQLFNSEHLVP